MIKQYSDKTIVQNDSWRCCVASILELEKERVPDFTKIGTLIGDGNWWMLTRRFVKSQSGLDMFWKEITVLPEVGTPMSKLGPNPHLKYAMHPYAILVGTRHAKWSGLFAYVLDLASMTVVHNPYEHAFGGPTPPQVLETMYVLGKEVPF